MEGGDRPPPPPSKSARGKLSILRNWLVSSNSQHYQKLMIMWISVCIHRYNNYMHYNYIPEKRKFSGILCFRQQRSRRVVRRHVTISLSAR